MNYVDKKSFSLSLIKISIQKIMMSLLIVHWQNQNLKERLILDFL